jgi:PAS domain S-box-containing protein
MRNSIRTRLTIAFIGVATGPLLLVGIVLAWQSFAVQRQQALSSQRQVAQRVAIQVTAFFQKLEDELRLVSQVQGLHGLDRDQQRALLSRQLAYQDVFEELVLLDSQGQEQIVLSRLGLTPTTLNSRASADEFVIPQTTNQAYYSPIHLDQTSGEPLMTIAVPLSDARTGLVEGVLVAKARIKKIWQLVADIQLEPGQSVYIVDAQGDVAAHQNPSVVLRGTHFNAPDRDGVHPGLTGSRVVLATDTVRLGEQAFHVVAEQTVSEALALAISSVVVIAVMMLAALLLGGGLSVIMARQIVQPIQAMATTAQAISDGDLWRQVQIARQDELGVLGRAFNSMTGQLQTLIDDLKQEVAEHRRTAEALRENEERLRMALEGTTDGIWDWNLATGQRYFSPRYYAMLGYEPNESPPADEGWQQLIHPDDVETTAKAVQHALEEQTPFAIESRAKAKNGEWRWIMVRGKAVEVDEEGKAVRVAGSYTDITERKQTEAQIARNLRETRVRYEVSQALAGAETEDKVLDVLIQHAGLYPQAHVSIFTFDRTGGELVAVLRRVDRPELRRAHPFPVGARFPVASMPVMNLYSTDRPFVSNDVFADERVDPTTREVFRRSNVHGEASFAVFPLTAGNEWVGYIALAAESTGYFDEEKQHLYQTLAEQGGVALRAARLRETIRESQQRMSLLVQQSPLAVIELNTDLQVVSWNPAAERIFGYTRDEAQGRSVTSLIVPEAEQPIACQNYRDLLAQQGSTRDTQDSTTKDGRLITCEWFNSPLVSAQGETVGVASLAQDVTERIQAEEEIRRLNAELEQRVIERTAQLEAAVKELEAFSYSVSHDLRAPLRAMDGFSRILLEDYAPQLPPEVARHLKTIRTGSQQMGRLIDDLLVFSRLSRLSLDKQTVDATHLVRQALHSLSGEQAGRRVEISIGELPPCRGDPTLLQQVWTNLLSNALKFTRGRDGARIEVGCTEQDGEPVYFVRDNGAGFDMQYADKLFGVFQRLHHPEEYEGTGIGLAIVQRIIARHGGRVWAEGEVNHGATFRFALPQKGDGAPTQQMFIVGIVNHVPILVPMIEGFKVGMAESGYVQGETVTYIYNGITEPDPQAIDDEIEALLAQGTDLLFLMGDSVAERAKLAVAGTDHPVVFGAVGDAMIRGGLVESLRRPGGNLTGVRVGTEIPEALERLVTITPGATKVYVPHNPEELDSVVVLASLDQAASQLGIELVRGEVYSVEEAVAAIEHLPEDIDAIFRIPSPTLDARNDELSQTAIERGLPMGAGLRLDEAVLITVTVDFFETGKQAARSAHQIRQGIKPADLPVETAPFYVTINLRTARAIGLDIPDEILEQADIIIR